MPLNLSVIESLKIPEDELVKMFIADIREVFSTMVGIEDLLHLPVQIEPITEFNDCVTAMVGLAGGLSGMVSIHAPMSVALQVTSGMLGMEVTELDDDVRDAMGEIANMIAGSCKLHLSKGGADLRISTPSVVTGSEYVIASGTATNTITLRFATDDDWFMVAITLQEE